ncbi:MAG TPA: hypothetical protein PKB10_11805 [Tepidisphaeraceae bacterium]|nr:hypothetical protein [Tepidisphaeraceae bacterium]
MPDALWQFLWVGYPLTVAIELPILLVGLSRVHAMRTRVLAGFWLTACTYPIVVLVLPLMIADRTLYLIIAETFAPLAECVIFALAFQSRGMALSLRWRDWGAIVVANLASFLIGWAIFSEPLI